MRGTDCLKKLSFPSRAVRHIRGQKMVYFWAAVVASLATIVLYCQLPFIVFPALLFVAFLASGGRNFPKVFFRTILRDLMYVYLNIIVAYMCSISGDPGNNIP